MASFRNMYYHYYWCYCLLFLICQLSHSSAKDAAAAAAAKTHDDDDRVDELLVFTVCTEKTDGYFRYVEAAQKLGIDFQVLGLGQQWNGGDVKNNPGGGQKVKLLKEALEKIHKNRPNLIVMFTDCYDVIINGEPREILKRFKQFDGARIVFSAEGYCWPDKTLAPQYPIVKSGKRYLNSGLFIGSAKDLYKLVSDRSIVDDDDDQLFYTKIFLDENLRTKLKIELDHVSLIFQNLNGAIDDVELDFSTNSDKDIVVDSKGTVESKKDTVLSKKDTVGSKGGYVKIRNVAYSTNPLVVHGNGPTKEYLNYLGNYVGRAWNKDIGCIYCSTLQKKFGNMEDKNLPIITLALFIERATPFLDDFFDKISTLNYPKSRIHLFLHNSETLHDQTVNEFLSKLGDSYRSTSVLNAKDSAKEADARNQAIEMALQKMSQFLFVVDSDVRLTNSLVITTLMDHNKAIIAPMVSKPNKLWANFWGALSDDGFYARSDDYVDIVENFRKGIWNVAHISSVYLIKSERLTELKNAYTFNKRFDPDMSFPKMCLDKGFFMHVDNMEPYGYLIETDDYDTSMTHPDLYQLFSNKQNWETEYLHKDYPNVLTPTYKIEQPCPDVYWFPLFTPKFCQQLIDIMETFGKWSAGSNKDERLAGGYENVPTRDIHMNQVGLERHWLHILDQYVRPVQEKVFVGYFHVPPTAIMNFVVRYRPDEQPALKPHHDASTYTINLNLNRPSIDYEGGGARFIRYNCSVVDLRQGWGLLHPGRLTHYHEGLPTTKGTRYIMVSFVDP